MEWKAKWLKAAANSGEAAPIFKTEFKLNGRISSARLYVTSLGVYEASINAKRVGKFVLAPGWTAYDKRLQYQEYDVTGMMKEHNILQILAGKGWYLSRLAGWVDSSALQENPNDKHIGILAQLELLYTDGRKELICSDSHWTVGESRVRFSEIYDGEIYDASFTPVIRDAAEVFDGPYGTLIPQQGEEVKEQERIRPSRLFATPKGELVVDFGQEITGYAEISFTASAGDTVDLSFGEVLDKEGNFYHENYRSAKAIYHYTCTDGYQTCKPKLTFYGFRYIRINEFPGGVSQAAAESFTAVTVHSEMKRTGYISCSSTLLNRLFDNIIWGQKGNFLDVPTDCPQRDERLGWTGDAQVFVRTACLNYDVEKFFTKWLADMAAEQGEDGYIGDVIPDILHNPGSSAAWGDAAAICPWEIYLNYGNPDILKAQFTCMKKWVDYITTHTKTQYLWIGGRHYGDWLGLDSPSGSYKGSSRDDFIASAYYARSTSLVIKAGHVLGKDVTAYEDLYEHIIKSFRSAFPSCHTQTECVLAAHFKLASDCQAAADQLADMVRACGTKLQTGFVGTPYLLHVLSDYGYTELAYSLLLRESYPSWIYPVTKGATTVWEHWDGIMEDGSFWSADMNSFNHYAYGAVADWVYGTAAGITPVEEAPGFARVRIEPHTDSRLDWLKASLKTRHGEICSGWRKAEGRWRYEITTPVEAAITISGKQYVVPAGSYLFFSDMV